MAEKRIILDYLFHRIPNGLTAAECVFQNPGYQMEEDVVDRTSIFQEK